MAERSQAHHLAESNPRPNPLAIEQRSQSLCRPRTLDDRAEPSACSACIRPDLRRIFCLSCASRSAGGRSHCPCGPGRWLLPPSIVRLVGRRRLRASTGGRSCGRRGAAAA